MEYNNKEKKQEKENIDKLNAHGLIGLALIFADSSNEFFKMELLKDTRYTRKDLINCKNNFLYLDEKSLENKTGRIL